MKVDALLKGISVRQKVNWAPHRSIKKITSDSRSVESGDVFVACRGSRMDGHDFLGQAVLARASLIICEELPEFPIPKHVTALKVKDSRACLAQLLNNFYSSPHQDVQLIGVTGTNGKTTIAYLLHRLLREKTKAAYLGTLWYELPAQKIISLNTTPGPETLIPLLEQMRQENVTHCIMEISSHALEQRRVHDLQYEVAAFTQLTQDHLDYHKTMESYFQAKRLFFANRPRPRKSLINRDCPYGRRLLEEFPRSKSYSLSGDANYQAVDIVPSFQGSQFRFKYKRKDIPFQLRLPMKHNVANAVCVLGILDMMGFDPEDFKGMLQEIPGIPGRLEMVSGGNDFQVFVDYAHTPDAVENVLKETRSLKPKRILTLLGCGGDRDKSKRPLMAQAACRWSDIAIFTSDNPRSEDPELILQDMREGVEADKNLESEVYEILDRHLAIEKLIQLAEPGDIVLVLGKGHEDYQILGDRKIPFDDRLVVQECLKRKSRVFFS